MGIVSKMVTGRLEFRIPNTGKMFRSSNGLRRNVLCYVHNKGYLEADDVGSLSFALNELASERWAVLVGGIDKIHLKGGNYVYRQRVFFKNFIGIIKFCKKYGILLDFTDDFEVDINNIMCCIEELCYLERYAKLYKQSIDAYLTGTCIVHTWLVVEGVGGDASALRIRAENILKGKMGYLNYAPMLVSRYDIEKHTSSVYVPDDISDRRMFTTDNYGYTSDKLKSSLRNGVIRFKKGVRV